MTARRIIVRGEVQGVFYRNWTVQQAKMLGIAGWVRNRRDGSVEIAAQGDEAALRALIDLCWKGPPAARVTAVDVEDSDDIAADGFEKRATL